jgi:hypothetical protein
MDTDSPWQGGASRCSFPNRPSISAIPVRAAGGRSIRLICQRAGAQYWSAVAQSSITAFAREWYCRPGLRRQAVEELRHFEYQLFNRENGS